MSGKKLEKDYIPASQWSSAILPVLQEGHELKIPLSGLSMYPLIVGGRDEALLSAVKGKRLKRGDIVLYVRCDNTHVLHRIHHIRKNTFYMLGDAQTVIEGPIYEKDILAVANVIYRKGMEIDCNNILYRIFSDLWLFARPLRPKIFRLLKFLIHIFQR